MSFTDERDTDSGASRFTQLVNYINAGIWEFNVNTNETEWSDGFYKVLGFEPGEIECSHNFFYENILYHEDYKLFTKSINECTSNKSSIVQVRLLTKKSGYQWFENTSWRIEEASKIILYGTLVNINACKLAGLQSEKRDIAFYELGRIAKIAAWEIDVNTRSLSISPEAYDIFELSRGLTLTIEEMISFFEPDGRQAVSSSIDNIIKFSKSFDEESLFRTARNQLTWLRIKAIPVIDNFGRCITVRGIFQDLNHVKKRQADLEQSLSISTDQNKRLQNFAYIVSHNLRSNTGNLKFMVDLFSETDMVNERGEIFEHIRAISDNLNITVKRLEEVVKIHAENDKERETVNFEKLFKEIISSLHGHVNETGANIDYDFSKCPEIEYIPAYMESILQNLLTNALKYRRTDCKLLIKCKTLKNDGHDYLTFEDNGQGIDLARYGEQVFGMYKTFHRNSDAKGIGLFITRSQIESLGGSISVQSKVNAGTRFTVKFN